ncbi:DUF7126 family protein [Halomarina ordinaria]|uniref:NAD-binding protein n=1 Tax=Halomarina ordinaria TaxID=3033939 RepID=A0ABD5U6U4_9EURY|nr:NAD-binding protein [Halomarina sp. PSRA2]
MQAVIVGSDPEELSAALEAHGAQTTRAAGTATRDALRDAGIEEADLLVVTDVGLATAIPLARELNPDVRVVVYAHETVPEFARASAGLIVDPDLMDADTVADELV